MSIFRWNWLYKIVRRRTNPIPEPVAAKWKQRLSIVYMLSAWNVFGILLYFYFGKKEYWGKYYGIKSEEELQQPSAVYYAELLGLEKAHVIDIKKFRVVNEYDYVKEESTEQEKSSNGSEPSEKIDNEHLSSS